MRRVLLVFACLFVAASGCDREKKAAPSPPAQNEAAPQTAPPGAAPAAVEKRDWRLVDVGGQAVTTPPDGNAPTLRLEAGNASGHGGCNRFRGSYRLEGTALSFGPLMSTKMACPAMDAEGRYMQALEKSARWQTHDGQLELQDASGTVLARFAS